MGRVKIKESLRWPQRSVEEFFDTWTPEMAYVLGYFAADGSMYQNPRGSRFVSFCSTDIDQIRDIRELLGVQNKVEEYRSFNPHWKNRYTLQVGSHRLFRRLIELGFTQNKSRTLQFPHVPDQQLPHFVRGYFDGDGCVLFQHYFRKDRGRTYPLLQTRFVCGSHSFLKDLQQNLKSIANVGLGSLHRHTRAWELGYNTRDSRQLYQFMYPTSAVPCLRRKKDIFEQAIMELKK